MKKLISICLIIFVIFSLCAVNISAQTDNLLSNADFEKGSIIGWQNYGPTSSVIAKKEAAHSGSYGALISERTGKYSTIAQNIHDIYYNNGAGTYRASMWVRLKDNTDARVKCQLVVTYAASGKAQQWVTSRILMLTNEWQEFTIEKNIDANVYELEYMYLYPQVEGVNTSDNLDFYVDDASFKKVSEVIKPDPNYVDIDVVENAKTPNLITDGDFESGEEDIALHMGRSDFVFEKEYAHSGEYGIRVQNRETNYTTIGWDLLDAYWDNGPGQYRACAYVRLNSAEDENLNVKCELVIKYNLKGQSTQYIVSGKKVLTTKWQKFILDRELPFDPAQISSIYIYPQVISADNNVKVDFCIDDVTLYKTTEVIAPDPNAERIEDIKVDNIPVTPIDVTNVDRNNELTSVGVIRWDAWYGHDNITNSVISQVEKTLSPKQFHFRAPFFAEVSEDGGIIVPEYTQEIFDQEMEYAIQSGIDYFAFLWYDDAMQKARKFYQTSKYNDKVKMCVILDSKTPTAEQHQEMAKLLQSDYYMTVLNGRPLMYYDCGYDAAKEQIAYYRALSVKLGFPEPYAVCLKLSADKARKAFADGVGDYAVSNESVNISFFELGKKAEKVWLAHQREDAQYVPIVTTGYHLLPRYINQVTWQEIKTDRVAEYATADEIGAHLTAALEYMQKADVIEKTKINTVLMYAWNEHDEGGWICPTLKVDENGNQLYGANGEKLVDTSRIEAVRKAIDAFKAKYAHTLAEKPTTPGEKPGTTQTNNNIWIYFGVGGAVLLIGAAVAIVVVVKKKNNKKEEKNEQ